MSNRLDPVQDRHSVGPDLGPNCLHCYVMNRQQKSPQQRDNPVNQNTINHNFIKLISGMTFLANNFVNLLHFC